VSLDDVTTDELASRLGDQGLVLLDVRSPGEYDGSMGAPCDPRQGHVPGARNLDVNEIVGLSADELRARVGAPEGAEVIAYCHSGSRSSHAVAALRAAGYAARNYTGSWHEWSRHEALPLER
jgi:thiosulfate/3-mercaptopyruvate sulfurtransferase